MTIRAERATELDLQSTAEPRPRALPVLPAPDDATSVLPADVNEALLEIRALKTQMQTAGDRLGRLEKNLRQLLKDQ